MRQGFAQHNVAVLDKLAHRMLVGMRAIGARRKVVQRGKVKQRVKVNGDMES